MKRLFVALLLLSGLTAAAQQPVAPALVAELPSTLNGSSSLFFWEGLLWSCNDHDSLTLYGIDTATGTVTQQIATELPINDLEEVTQDQLHLYFGDFGNNAHGKRHNLRILRIKKSQMLSGDYRFDTIAFSYPGQTDGESNGTDFDCEAFITAGDSLYLFTKQWLSQMTICYALPKSPGRHLARAVDTLDVNGLVTGAAYDSIGQTLVFCGYSTLCQPFLYLLHGFSGHQFFCGARMRLPLNCSMGTQTEGIATTNGRLFYLSNENFSKYGIKVPPRLVVVDLGGYLDSSLTEAAEVRNVRLVPNPATQWVRCVGGHAKRVTLTDLLGRVVLQKEGGNNLDLSSLTPGCYIARIECGDSVTRQTLVRR